MKGTGFAVLTSLVAAIKASPAPIGEAFPARDAAPAPTAPPLVKRITGNPYDGANLYTNPYYSRCDPMSAKN